MITELLQGIGVSKKGNNYFVENMKAAHVNKNLARFNKEHAAEAPTAEQMSQIKKDAELLAEQIRAREEDCLKTIHTRFCIVKGLPVDINDIERHTPKKTLGRNNYYEYWYKFGTPQAAFLMSREILLNTGMPVLQIMFNRELARGDENATDNIE